MLGAPDIAHEREIEGNAHQHVSVPDHNDIDRGHEDIGDRALLRRLQRIDPDIEPVHRAGEEDAPRDLRVAALMDGNRLDMSLQRVECAQESEVILDLGDGHERRNAVEADLEERGQEDGVGAAVGPDGVGWWGRRARRGPRDRRRHGGPECAKLRSVASGPLSSVFSNMQPVRSLRYIHKLLVAPKERNPAAVSLTGSACLSRQATIHSSHSVSFADRTSELSR